MTMMLHQHHVATTLLQRRPSCAAGVAQQPRCSSQWTQNDAEHAHTRSWLAPCQHVARASRPGPQQQQQQRWSAAVAAAAAATGAAAPDTDTDAAAAGRPGYQLPPDIDPEQLLATLLAIKTYTQLAAFVRSREDALLRTPLCVYALLHAAQLRETLQQQQPPAGGGGGGGGGQQQQEERSLVESQLRMEQEFELVEALLGELCDAATSHAPGLPLLSQATLALALGQLEFCHGPLLAAIAASVKQQLAVLQPAQAALPAAAGSSAAGSPAASTDPQPAARKAAVLAAMEEDGLVPGVLLSLSVACSLSGFHDAELLDQIASQAVAFQGSFPDAAPLLGISAAMLDLQHDCPELLQAAAAAVVAQDGPVAPEEVVSLMLALSFFGVPAPEFTELALEALSEAAADVAEELEPQQLAHLWMALVLLREQQGVATPPVLMELLQYAVSCSEQEQGGDEQQAAAAAAQALGIPRDLLLLGSCRGALACLQHPQVLADAPEGLQQQWEQAGVLAATEMLRALQEQHGWVLQAGVLVPAKQQQQQQQGAAAELELPPAVVDVSAQLPDGRTVAVVVLFGDSYCAWPAATSRLKGPAAIDVLVLQTLGCAVLPLPVTEWQALGGDAEQQQRYLQARVEAALSTA